MWKTLRLTNVDPMKALERSLLRARDHFVAENSNSMRSSVRIIIKKKKVINRGT